MPKEQITRYGVTVILIDQVFLLQVEIWLPLPFLMFGVLSLTAGILSLILPETHHKKLPESIADGENFGK
jgi:hypothetical protein